MGPIKRFLATWGNGDFGRQIPVMHGDVVSSRDNEQDELYGVEDSFELHVSKRPF